MHYFIQNPRERKDLNCYFSSSKSSWLRLGPMKIQLNWENPYIISIKQFMSSKECNEITNGLGQKLEGFVEYANDEDADDVKVMKK